MSNLRTHHAPDDPVVLTADYQIGSKADRRKIDDQIIDLQNAVIGAEIQSLYASSQQPILAVAATPGWNVIGGFPMLSTVNARLSVIGSVSDASLTLNVRLYCITPGSVGAVSASVVSISTVVDSVALSAVFTLTAGYTYQVQAEVVGNVGDDYFGYPRRVAPVGA